MRLERVRRRFERAAAWPRVQTLEPDSRWSTLFLAPHPDDEAIWCGGLLARVSSAGGVVDGVFLTDGVRDPASEAALAARRRAEADESCRILGVRRLERLGLPDGSLLAHVETAADHVAARLRAGTYSHVVCPWPYDWHDDHAATYRVLKRALGRGPRAPRVILYEGWGTLEPNAAIAIDSVLEAKKRAIAAHRSQNEAQDFVSLGTALSRFRSTCIVGATHAEAFFCLPATELSRLA